MCAPLTTGVFLQNCPGRNSPFLKEIIRLSAAVAEKLFAKYRSFLYIYIAWENEPTEREPSVLYYIVYISMKYCLLSFYGLGLEGFERVKRR